MNLAMPGPASLRLHYTGADWVQYALLLLGLVLISAALGLPLLTLGWRAFTDTDGQWIGLDNFLAYAGNPALRLSLWHSIWISAASTVIVVSLAFGAALVVTRTTMPGRKLFRAVLFLPLLAPSLLSGLALVYWFGKQGVANGLLMGAELYGPVGIVLGSCFWTLPHAYMILITAFSNADGRLYEAARVLGARPWRVFFTVTLPGVRYGLINAAFVVFTLVFTDFGVPKVIGGQYNVVATDIYKQVIGQQNFGMGAAISILLLLPAVLAFFAERWSARRQSAALGSRSTVYHPAPSLGRDAAAGLYALLLSGLIVAVIGMAFYASLVTYWPYDLKLGFGHYAFDQMAGSGWQMFGNSLRMAFWVAMCGSLLIFLFAYLVEKGRHAPVLRHLFRFMAILPLAVPGLVLGLAYVFFFNSRANPANGLYGTLTILVICTVAHYYAVPHITASAAIQQMDREYESANAMLRAPFWRLLRKVIFPVCLPAILDIWFYLFVNGMTTVSAVIFLYMPDTTLASVAALSLDDAGETATAAAMACLVISACGVVKLLQWLLTHHGLARLQRWRTN